MTEKQKKFCDYYIELDNATQAAIRAGYSKKTAKSQGSENLTKPDIAEYIDLRLKSMESDRIAGAEEVLEYFTRVMRGEEKDQFGLDASLTDRNKAGELLGKKYKLFTDKQEIEAKDPVRIIADIPRSGHPAD
ncbi:MAG: terminase small subunit [Clostridia bacterium]|nr:terminase small subunit [Clostridia bacterium]